MEKPILLAVDDDAQVLRAVVRDLRSNYRENYKIVSTQSATEALDELREMKVRGEEPALLLSDQRMPEMLGVEYLSQARKIFPSAKTVLLTAYSDTDAAIKAINDVQLDYYLMKPWDPPQEKLFPVITDLLDDWQANYRPPYKGLRLIGYQYSPQTHRIKDFLSGNLFPYAFMDVETNQEARELLKVKNLTENDLPVLIFEDGTALSRSELPEIASRIGLKPHITTELYDVIIVGAGPAGLAAAVYGGSEGLHTALVEKRAPGGQAGTSSRIENYLGFPNGLSGSDLSRRAITQATRFGVEFLSPLEVRAIRHEGSYKKLELASGNELVAKAVVITTGVDYRRHPAENIDHFTGAGVYYGAATTEAASCRNQDVYVVGGGNSAGQAAVYLSNFARKVFIVIRRESLISSMSSYLIHQISQLENVELLPFTEIIKADGDRKLETITLTNIKTNEQRTEKAGSVFIFIGARPVTHWVGDGVLRDDKGFIYTGRDLERHPEFKRAWQVNREPYLLETAIPGVFAAGDVRYGAMNRVASAVGEGAMSISFVHRYLAET